MRLLGNCVVLAVAVEVACLPATARPEAAGNSIAVQAVSGRVLTQAELYSIYAGQTWQWKDGAAYFEPGQQFEAWARKDNKPSYADGSWSVSDNGQLCIRATWHSAGQLTEMFNCYLHRRSNAIYQRELPDGQWYVLSHIPVQAGDEIRKFEPGNHISADYLKISKDLTPSRKLRGKVRSRVKTRPAARPN